MVCMCAHATCMHAHTDGLHTHTYVCVQILLPRNPNSLIFVFSFVLFICFTFCFTCYGLPLSPCLSVLCCFVLVLLLLYLLGF